MGVAGHDISVPPRIDINITHFEDLLLSTCLHFMSSSNVFLMYLLK